MESRNLGRNGLRNLRNLAMPYGTQGVTFAMDIAEIFLNSIGNRFIESTNLDIFEEPDGRLLEIEGGNAEIEEL
ncbi:unnamed protein product [Rhizophagus irregularis]|nr:unnamed protein product [Rhizophagus irregularis]